MTRTCKYYDKENRRCKILVNGTCRCGYYIYDGVERVELEPYDGMLNYILGNNDSMWSEFNSAIERLRRNMRRNND